MTTDALVARWVAAPGRWIVAGPPGRGKSTLVTALARAGAAPVLSADPGQPLLGPPGAVSVGEIDGAVRAVAGLGTLDALRFRMPLALAAARIAPGSGPLLVDAPGVARGAGAVELLSGLCPLLSLDVLVWLDHAPCPHRGDLPGVEVIDALPSPDARSPSGAERAARRTALWDGWLAGAYDVALSTGALAIGGTPPPRDAWPGRQAVVLGSGGETLAVGEVREAGRARVVVRAPGLDPERAAGLVIRDAVRDPQGTLRTAPSRGPRRAPAPSLDAPTSLPSGEAASELRASLVGGITGDPMLRLDVVHQPRTLLVDLGEHPELSVRVAHRVSHVFVSHAHMDHFNGFPWLLRRRIGQPDPVTLVGPPALAERVGGFVDGITWDRIGDEGPRFRVGEVHDGTLRWFVVRAGGPRGEVGRAPIPDGVVLREPGFVVRAAVLDHGIPVLAWAIEEPTRFGIRPDALAARGLRPGPWLGELKRHLALGETDAHVDVPDGTRRAVGALAAELVVARRGRKLVYATDFGDTPENRRRLVALARGADVFVCEASFLVEDADRAAATGHMTTRATAEIAAEADVGVLVPFHFSARYADRIGDVYAELRAGFPRVWAPRGADQPPAKVSRSGS